MDTQTQALYALAETIKNNHLIDTYKPDLKYNKSDKNHAKYNMGVALLAARQIFTENIAFGQWVKTNINDPLVMAGYKPLAKNTPANYMALPRFGSFDACIAIGFSNVYNLISKNDEVIISTAHDIAVNNTVCINGEAYNTSSLKQKHDAFNVLIGRYSAKKIYTEVELQFSIECAKIKTLHMVCSVPYNVDALYDGCKLLLNHDLVKTNNDLVKTINEFMMAYL